MKMFDRLRLLPKREGLRQQAAEYRRERHQIKRLAERALRNAGWSKTQALIEVARLPQQELEAVAAAAQLMKGLNDEAP